MGVEEKKKNQIGSTFSYFLICIVPVNTYISSVENIK